MCIYIYIYIYIYIIKSYFISKREREREREREYVFPKIEHNLGVKMTIFTSFPVYNSSSKSGLVGTVKFLRIFFENPPMWFW